MKRTDLKRLVLRLPSETMETLLAEADDLGIIYTSHLAEKIIKDYFKNGSVYLSNEDSKAINKHKEFRKKRAAGKAKK